MVEEPSHGEPLLVSSREGISPFALRVPPSLAFDDRLEFQHTQDRAKVVVAHAAGIHLRSSVGIDDLIAKGAEREIGSLRDVGEFGRGRLRDGSAWQRQEERTRHPSA